MKLNYSESLRNLWRCFIASLRSGSITIERFCSSFEKIYIFDLDKQRIDPQELSVLSALFAEAVRYSSRSSASLKEKGRLWERDVWNAINAVDAVLAAEERVLEAHRRKRRDGYPA